MPVLKPDEEVKVFGFMKRGIYANHRRRDEDVHFCRVCLWEVSQRILIAIHPTSKETRLFWKDKLRGEFHEFWSDAMHFVASSQAWAAAGVEAALETRLSQIASECTKHELHIATEQKLLSSRRTFGDFGSLQGLRSSQEDLVLIVAKALWSISARTSGYGLLDPMRSARWPATVLEALPFGGDSFVENMAWLGANLQHNAVLPFLLAQAIRALPDTLYPSTVAKSSILLAWLCSEIQWSATDATRGNARSSAAIGLCQSSCELLLVLGHAPLNLRGLLIGQNAAMVQRTIDQALVNARATKMVDCQAMLAVASKAFMDYLPSAGTLMSHCETAMEEFACSGDPMDDPYGRFQLYILFFVRQQECSFPACGKTSDSSNIGHRQLKLCAKCRLCRYCSRECQKAHWRAQVRPHKESCSLLQHLTQNVPELQLSARSEADDDYTAASVVSAACTERQVSIDELALIVYHINCMLTRDQNHRDEYEQRRQIRELKKEILGVKS